MSASSRVLLRAVAVVLSTVAMASSAAAAEKKPKPTGTIKDLETREVQVTRDPPTNVQPQQAIEQYKQFLQLQSDNPQMRAEAMRRLGDLQLEVDEGARAGSDASFQGL